MNKTQKIASSTVPGGYITVFYTPRNEYACEAMPIVDLANEHPEDMTKAYNNSFLFYELLQLCLAEANTSREKLDKLRKITKMAKEMDQWRLDR